MKISNSVFIEINQPSKQITNNSALNLSLSSSLSASADANGQKHNGERSGSGAVPLFVQFSHSQTIITPAASWRANGKIAHRPNTLLISACCCVQ
jgi:hypothetical protein